MNGGIGDDACSRTFGRNRRRHLGREAESERVDVVIIVIEQHAPPAESIPGIVGYSEERD